MSPALCSSRSVMVEIIVAFCLVRASLLATVPLILLVKSLIVDVKLLVAEKICADLDSATRIAF